ncbi:hypothetical protein ACT691_05330 [Vibrio metschnikovii]
MQRIIHPEEEMGVQCVADALNYPMVNDYLSLGHGLYVDGSGIFEHQGTISSIGRTRVDAKGSVQTVLIKRGQEIDQLSLETRFLYCARMTSFCSAEPVLN